MIFLNCSILLLLCLVILWQIPSPWIQLPCLHSQALIFVFSVVVIVVMMLWWWWWITEDIVLNSSLSGLGFSVPPSVFIVPAPLLPFQNILIFYFWQNVVHWRREWRTTSVFLPWAPHEQYERWKGLTLNDELPRLVGAQYATGEGWRNNSRKNEEMEPKQKLLSCGCDWLWK